MVGPNLTDNLWIHGCSPAEMVKNVTTGFPPLGMLPYGSGQKLDRRAAAAGGELHPVEAGHQPGQPARGQSGPREGLQLGHACAPRPRRRTDSTRTTSRSATNWPASTRTAGASGSTPASRPGGSTAPGRWSATSCWRCCSSAPFVKLNGQPILLLNVIERKFIVFGLVFWPQDFYLLVLCVLTGFVTIALVDVGGRAHLVRLAVPADHLPGDAVPEDRVADRRVGPAAGAPRQGAGHASTRSGARRSSTRIFFALSFLIANVFLAYIISADTLWTIVTDPPREHVAGLFAITVFSLVFYARLRALPRAGLHAGLSRTAA